MRRQRSARRGGGGRCGRGQGRRRRSRRRARAPRGARGGHRPERAEGGARAWRGKLSSPAMSRMDSVVVVGASLAGLRAVQALRRAGLRGARRGDRRGARAALRPAAALEGGAGRQVGPRTHAPAPARGRGARRRVAARAARRGARPRRAPRGARGRRERGLRRPRDRDRHGRAPLPGAPPLAGVHVLRTLDDCARAARGARPQPARRRDRRGLHRRWRWPPPAAGAASPSP